MASERTGSKLRVPDEGDIRLIKWIKVGPEQVAVRDIHHILYFNNNNLAGVDQALHIPTLSAHWRASFEEFERWAGNNFRKECNS